MTSRERRRASLPQNERIQLHLDNMAYEGHAIGRYDNQVVFVEYGIPGEDVQVDIYRRQSSFANGRVVEVETASPDRVEPPCPYFGECGGCQWQHISYERQLDLKRHVVQEQLRRIGKFATQPVSDTVPGEPWGYRNHVRFSTSEAGDVGFVRRNSRHFLPIDRCLIADPVINEQLAKLQGTAEGLHQVEVRVGVNSGDLLVVPDLTSTEPPRMDYTEVLFGRSFKVGNASFFQTNTRQTERLIELVRSRLTLTGSELLIDAYAGVGVFAALFGAEVARVIAIEEAPNACDDGLFNTRDLPNVEYWQGKVEIALPELDDKPDIIILDPPRQGCAPSVLDAIVKLSPPQLVYVSCDPATLARDLRRLVDGGYELLDVTPLDMFPQTFHVECVAWLRWVGPVVSEP